jgi:excisionase family DNA binding protein
MSHSPTMTPSRRPSAQEEAVMAERNARPPDSGGTSQGSDESTHPPGKLLLTAQEAAHRLGMSRTKVFQLITRKELSSVKIGGARRIPVWALYDFVDGLIGSGE